MVPFDVWEKFLITLFLAPSGSMCTCSLLIVREKLPLGVDLSTKETQLAILKSKFYFIKKFMAKIFYNIKVVLWCLYFKKVKLFFRNSCRFSLDSDANFRTLKAPPVKFLKLRLCLFDKWRQSEWIWIQGSKPGLQS